MEVRVIGCHCFVTKLRQVRDQVEALYVYADERGVKVCPKKASGRNVKSFSVSTYKTLRSAIESAIRYRNGIYKSQPIIGWEELLEAHTFPDDNDQDAGGSRNADKSTKRRRTGSRRDSANDHHMPPSAEEVLFPNPPPNTLNGGQAAAAAAAAAGGGGGGPPALAPPPPPAAHNGDRVKEEVGEGGVGGAQPEQNGGAFEREGGAGAGGAAPQSEEHGGHVKREGEGGEGEGGEWAGEGQPAGGGGRVYVKQEEEETFVTLELSQLKTQDIINIWGLDANLRDLVGKVEQFKVHGQLLAAVLDIPNWRNDLKVWDKALGGHFVLGEMSYINGWLKRIDPHAVQVPILG
ncbi:unnamed protein product [Vitrella brassicaformis CCMP3155]|uniref:Uncharacterized protein n=1 Tax=Vitrella brassicaformis (strain CCMP3155) TaxID=1169540 RepID=A0A0G4ECQ6_VITBC|nr:unnamed protein product [Vitrella brassicaformis CCMP3155]|eukprot:CEL93092.1 unnamed protein product [Vitrella brassicaformis CCMP3155]